MLFCLNIYGSRPNYFCYAILIIGVDNMFFIIHSSCSCEPLPDGRFLLEVNMNSFYEASMFSL